MSEMHDRGVRRPESGSELKDASRDPDHLSMIFATDLERRTRFKGAAVATREDRPLKLGRRGVQPPLFRDDAQPLVEIHRKVPRSRK
jgi:hypothetical protein